MSFSTSNTERIVHRIFSRKFVSTNRNISVEYDSGFFVDAKLLEVRSLYPSQEYFWKHNGKLLPSNVLLQSANYCEPRLGPATS